MGISRVSICCCALVLASCATTGPAPPTLAPGLAGSAACQPGAIRVSTLEGISETHGALSTWVGALPQGESDRVLLSADQIAALNQRNRGDAWGAQDVLANEVVEPNRVERELRERFAWLEERLQTGKYVEGKEGTLRGALKLLESSTAVVEARVVAREVDLRCVPSKEGFYTPPVDRDFDRNQCSRLHMGEVVRVLRVSADGAWRYVHAGHSVGWLYGEVLTPPLLVEDAQAFRAPPKSLVAIEDGARLPSGQRLRMGTALPLSGETPDGFTVIVPTLRGLVSSPLARSPSLHVGAMPFTRENIWRLSLKTLGDPYGWGERGGARDCSRLLLDLFRVFGLDLGRHSLAQARSGNRTVELKGMEPEAKLTALREAGRDNVVLLYMSGHIMLYLGELDGAPYAISAISEFVSPCAGEGDQVSRLDKVVVSGLEIGKGTARTSYLERLSRLAVFGR